MRRRHFFVAGLCLICGTSRDFHHFAAPWRKRPELRSRFQIDATRIGDRNRRFVPGLPA